MTIVVTGATGHLGRLTVESLLRRGVPADQIVAAGRSVERIADLAARGVRVEHIDFDDPATLGPVFAGADKVLLVSGSEPGKRVPQHRNAIEALKAAGTGLVAYTSIANADTTDLLLAKEHQETEALLRESGLPVVLLRNSWYTENYARDVEATKAAGAMIGAAGEGRISVATRADYAEAAAAVLTAEENQAGKVYELGGDEAVTLAEIAAELSKVTGTTIVYRDMTQAEFEQTLVGFGLPAPAAQVFADVDRGLAKGMLRVDTGDLSRLIGRPTTPLAQAFQAVTTS